MKNKNKTLIEIWKETYPKLRPWVAIILVGALLTSILADDTKYKMAVLYALASNVIFLIFDLSNSIKMRLDKIDNNLKEPDPPFYVDFNAALPVIRNILSDRLSKNRDIHIRVLAVSAQFSWKSLVDTTIPALFDIGSQKQKINIEFVIVKPSVLRDWGQKQLESDANSTLLGIENFKGLYKKEFAAERLTLNIYQYDNMPHWHGILIDNDILFMGRCKWKIIEGKYKLMVGQIDYRQFRTNDRFGGKTRVELVDNWFEAYKFRAQRIKLKNNKENDLNSME